MQEEVVSEGEISLSDIFRALWAKIWIILASLLVGVIVGGTLGFVKNHDVHYYGASVDYFITSNKTDDSSGQINPSNYNETVFITVTSLLSSELFSQELMKDLPETSDVVFPQSENFTEADGKKYDKYLKLLNNSLSYTYNYKASQIKVSVSVLNDAGFAASLLKQVEKNVPEFIESRLVDKDSSSSTTTPGKVSCEQLTHNRAALLNGGQTTKEMIKFAAILGILAAIVACVVVVVIDRTDNRLRDYEDIPGKFGLPVLGVIPRIEALAEDKKAEKHTEAIK